MAITDYCLKCKNFTRKSRDGRCFDCKKTNDEIILGMNRTSDIIRFCVQYCYDVGKIDVKQYVKVKKYNKHKIKW